MSGNISAGPSSEGGEGGGDVSFLDSIKKMDVQELEDIDMGNAAFDKAAVKEVVKRFIHLTKASEGDDLWTAFRHIFEKWTTAEWINATRQRMDDLVDHLHKRGVWVASGFKKLLVELKALALLEVVQNDVQHEWTQEDVNTIADALIRHRQQRRLDEVLAVLAEEALRTADPAASAVATTAREKIEPYYQTYV